MPSFKLPTFCKVSIPCIFASSSSDFDDPSDNSDFPLPRERLLEALPLVPLDPECDPVPDMVKFSEDMVSLNSCARI